MKMIFISLLALSTSLAFAQTKTSTECTFKKNPKNKVYFDFDYNGRQLDLAKTLLLIQTKNGVKDFSYYNYAFMVDGMSHGSYIPYGRRAEIVNFADEIEQSGRWNFSIINYGATASSLVFNSNSRSIRSTPATRWAKRAVKFEGVVKTILKTENISQLENGTELSVNEVSCIQQIY